MMFGFQDEFTYLECDRCGCIQRLTTPTDWSRYYPEGYYSFSSPSAGTAKRFLKRIRARHSLGSRSPLGEMLIRRLGEPAFVKWIQPLSLAWNAPILDFGSGSGHVLRDMSDAGFSNLLGIDPYLPEDRIHKGFRLLRRSLGEIDGRFDLIMMNHSFEHLEAPEDALSETVRLLSPQGVLLVRTPVAGTFAWREYRFDWVQLDAPRHRSIQSLSSLKQLAERAGLTVRKVRFDSTSFQFWGSEQYRRGIPLRDSRSYDVDPSHSVFTSAEITDYERRAVALNADGDGDQACFYLRHR